MWTWVRAKCELTLQSYWNVGRLTDVWLMKNYQNNAKTFQKHLLLFSTAFSRTLSRITAVFQVIIKRLFGSFFGSFTDSKENYICIKDEVFVPPQPHHSETFAPFRWHLEDRLLHNVLSNSIPTLRNSLNLVNIRIKQGKFRAKFSRKLHGKMFTSRMTISDLF